MDEPTTQQTGTTQVGDAAQQATTQQADTTTQAQVAQTTQSQQPTETEAERGLRQAADAERKKRQEMEAQLIQSQVVIQQLAGQLRNQVQNPLPAPVSVDPIEQMTEQDFLDPAKVKNAVLLSRSMAEAKANQRVADLEFKMQFPDFDQLVGTTDPNTLHLPEGQRRFVHTELLQEAMNEDPLLMQKIQQMGNTRAAQVFVYEVARRQKQLRELRVKQVQVQPSVQPIASRAAINTADSLTAPMSPSSVSGSQGNTTEIDYRKNPAALEDVIQRARMGEFDRRT